MLEKNYKYYGAYGSNLNVRQMSIRCPSASMVASMMLQDYKLVYKGSMGFAYLTIEPSKDNEVPIGIWQVSKEDEANLDYYEGYPDLYYKDEFYFKDKDGLTKSFFIYIMNEEQDYAIPAQSYINGCLEGYKDFGFDRSYLDEALNYSKQEAADED